MKSYTGNALVEYTLIGVLLTLACIAGSLNTGQGLAGFLQGLQTEMANHNERAASINQSGELHRASSGQSISSLLKLTEEERVLLKKPLVEKIQTTGANGTTELLAKQLQTMAEQLLEEGKITEAQNDAILRLANQGYRLAEIEGLIEQGLASQQSAITFDGQTYDPYELSILIGFSSMNPETFFAANVFSADYVDNQQPELAKFISLYQEVASLGLMSDPLVAATIESASTQIVHVAESMEDAIYFEPTASELNNMIASRITEMNSSKICTSGGFKEGSVLCSP